MSAGDAPGTVTDPQARRGRGSGWALVIGVAIMVAIGLVLLFLLTQATDNRELYEQNYARLFVVNIVVAVLIMAVIVWIVARLATRLRRGKFGSRLLVKLAWIFALVGLVPGMLIYFVSYQFVSRSIESWFDVKVEGALDAGLSLGRSTLDALGSELGNQVRTSAQQLGNTSDAAAGVALERLRDQFDAVDVMLWTANGRLVGSAGKSRFEIAPDKPPQTQFRAARSRGVTWQIEGLDEQVGAANRAAARIRVLALVPAPGIGLLDEARFLQVTQSLPPTLVTNALAVQDAYREYQERALGRDGLRRMYIGTLTLSLFLSVFGSIVLAVLLGNQLVRPLLVLAEGVRQVAAGDLGPKAALQGKDELGGLTRAFADMTQQLADARAAVERGLAAVDASRAQLQTILDNLTAGVIVLDAAGQVVSSNPGATRILRAPLAAWEGRPLAEVPGLPHFAARVAEQFRAFTSERQVHGIDHWQESFGLHPQGVAGAADDVTLIVRGAALPDGHSLVVFDDISEIVSAQRTQAWGEVARRLAHEIKNPLTPIQLSAERLEHKLSGKLPAGEQALLSKSVRTIVDQVAAMQRLVNEFRDYARLPAAELRPLDLNALVADVLHLYVDEHVEHESVPVRVELDPDCPAVLGDAQQIRQVVHNLLQNAQDASESIGAEEPRGPREVVLRTRWNETSGRVRLSVLDSGHGFDEAILKRAFEPYVTTKPKGTGLGLAVVKKIADEHGARVEISNRLSEGRVVGAQVSLSFAIGANARG